MTIKDICDYLINTGYMEQLAGQFEDVIYRAFSRALKDCLPPTISELDAKREAWRKESNRVSELLIAKGYVLPKHTKLDGDGDV